ncbi:MAG: glycosyltransferase family 4 protein [bacterium]
MTLVLLTPGTGTFYCGSCIRDDGLARGLARAGRDVWMVPLYLPQVTEVESTVADAPICFGGINVYLQQHSALFRRTPAWIDRLLDQPWLLRAAASLSDMTNTAAHGPLTVSMLRGEEGNQRKALDQLLSLLADHRPPPTAVCLSNALLVGLARRLREELRVPVVVTLQGEDAFLDSLAEPDRASAWEEMGLRIRDVDALVAVSRYYGDAMQQRLGFDRAKLHVIHNGIDVDGYEPAAADPAPPVLGYLARLTAGKGLDRLAEAFLVLRKRPELAGLRLHVAGSIAPGDEAYLESVRQRLSSAGAAPDVEIRTNLSLAEKQAFLRSFSVLCVPATYGESFGLYLLEAWASGVPVVQPPVASFPELVAATGGGRLAESAEPEALAAALGALLADPAERRELGRLGRAAVLERFTLDRMTREFLALVDGLAR